MADIFESESSNDVYNDDTIVYFENVLRSSPSVLSTVDINPSQSHCTEFPSFLISSEAQTNVTNTVSQISSLIPVTTGCNNMPTLLNQWQQELFKQPNPQEAEVTLGILQNLDCQNRHCGTQQHNLSITSGVDTSVLMMSPSVKAETHMDRNVGDVESATGVSEKMCTDSDAVFLEQLNAIFGQYPPDDGSPEVSSTIDGE